MQYLMYLTLTVAVQMSMHTVNLQFRIHTQITSVASYLQALAE